MIKSGKKQKEVASSFVLKSSAKVFCPAKGFIIKICVIIIPTLLQSDKNYSSESPVSSFSSSVSSVTIGAGDNIAASKERVGGVYKLVAIEKDGKLIPKIKVSEDAIKITNPGFKKLYRAYDKETGYAIADILCEQGQKVKKEN